MKILITGGLGFIGVNSAIDLYKNSHEIFILDNMSRKGNIDNYLLLKEKINFKFFNIDIRNFFELEKLFITYKFDVVLHLAAQVAVTFSVRDPRQDFEINALGTFNILECIRRNSPDSILLYSSTNKVYGEFSYPIYESEKKYHYRDYKFSISEEQTLDFHSPYGCSKGTADQYVRDYHRIYGLKTVVLRQSCIYGPNQFGIEDQGWVSWFSIASTFEKNFTIYGNGKQVRDVLHVHDLTALYRKIIDKIDKCEGQIFNVGGGFENTLSLLELLDLLESKLNKKLNYDFQDWRPGDQKIYISDISKLNLWLDWKPEINTDSGIDIMLNWIQDNKNLFSKLELI
jgi:CDP-paratose 2-epimerase